MSLREEWKKDALWASYRPIVRKKKGFYFCAPILIFSCTCTYTYQATNFSFCPPGGHWPHQSFLGHRFLVINRSVYIFAITATTTTRTTTSSKVTPLRWQRNYRRAPLWLPRLFAWLGNGNSECAVAILARDLGTDGGTNHRICDCWFYLASPGTCLFGHARRTKIHGAALVRSFFRPNILASKLFTFGGGGGLQYAASNCQNAVSRRFADISRSRKRLNKRKCVLSLCKLAN